MLEEATRNICSYCNAKFTCNAQVKYPFTHQVPGKGPFIIAHCHCRQAWRIQLRQSSQRATQTRRYNTHGVDWCKWARAGVRRDGSLHFAMKQVGNLPCITGEIHGHTSDWTQTLPGSVARSLSGKKGDVQWVSTNSSNGVVPAKPAWTWYVY